MKIIRSLTLSILLLLILCLEACSFGDGEIMDSFRGSGDPLFMAVGNVGGGTSYVYISEDGKTWIRATDPPTLNMTSAAFANGLFICNGNNEILKTENGNTWVEYSVSATYNYISFANSTFFSISGSSPYYIYRSSDGVTWSDPVNIGTAQINDFSYGGDYYIAPDIQGVLRVSEDGLSWTNIDIEYSVVNLVDSAYGNTLYVVVGGYSGTDSDIRVSHNATTWSNNLVPGNSGELRSVAYGNGRFVAVGLGGICYVSNDGILWNGPISIASAASGDLYKLCFGAGVFVAVGNNGTIVYSEDGINWSTNVGPNNSIIFYDIAFRP